MSEWTYDSLKARQGTQRSIAARCTTAAIAGAGTVAGLLAKTQTAGASLPHSASMFHMGTTTGLNRSFKAGWNAVERSLGPSNYVTGCKDGNGNLSETVATVRADIAAGRQVIVGVPIENGNRCGGTATAITKWSAKIQTLVTSVEKQAHWSRYFGGIALDEEGGFGYTVSQIKALNGGLETFIDTHGGAYNKPTYLWGQWYGSLGTSFDNYQYYRSAVIDTRPFPQMYLPQMSTLVEGACQRSSTGVICDIMPTVRGFSGSQAVPRLSARMKGKTVTSWGAKDWYERYTL